MIADANSSRRGNWTEDFQNTDLPRKVRDPAGTSFTLYPLTASQCSASSPDVCAGVRAGQTDSTLGSAVSRRRAILSLMVMGGREGGEPSFRENGYV